MAVSYHITWVRDGEFVNGGHNITAKNLNELTYELLRRWATEYDQCAVHPHYEQQHKMGETLFYFVSLNPECNSATYSLYNENAYCIDEFTICI